MNIQAARGVVLPRFQREIDFRHVRSVLFQDRGSAGRDLSHLLFRQLEWPELHVVGLARGGVPVAREVAFRLGAPLSILNVHSATPVHRDDAWVQLNAKSFHGATVLLVDDGMLTGSTMREAAATVRKLGPARVVAAVPVASSRAVAALRDRVDECACLYVRPRLVSLAECYERFGSAERESIAS